MQWKRHLPVVLLITVFAGLAYFALQPQPLLVRVASVTRGDLVLSLEEEGKTRVRQRYQISAPVTGYLHRVTLREGDSVSQGDTLLQLAPLVSQPWDQRQQQVLTQQLAAADARLAALTADLDGLQRDAQLAQAEWQRAQRLQRDKLLSDSAFDQAERTLRLAEARLKSARENRHAAEFERAALAAQLQPVDGQLPAPALAVTAPINGTVVTRFRDSAGVVQAGEVLLSLADLQDQEIVVEMLSDLAVQVKPGMRVRVQRWGGSQVLEGVVRRVEPGGFTRVSALGVEEQRALVIIDWVSPWSARATLGDAYRVDVEIILEQLRDVLLIPLNAAFRVDGEWAVYGVQQGVARLQKIEAGQRTGLQLQVVSGLAEGAPVIAYPDNRLADGVRVTTEPVGVF